MFWKTLGIGAAIVICAVAGSFAARPAQVKDTGQEFAMATFAGGCFWCMEPPFDELDGVVSTVSGYTGGHTENPTYEEVSGGGTGHAEVVRVTYEPSKVSYEKLLEVFWANIDPTVENRQFCDVGSQYRTAIFYHGAEQQDLAEKSKRAIASGPLANRPVFTEIVPAGDFYEAEEYHQDYYKKNPLRYKFYRYSCGRDTRLREIWDKSAS